MITIDITEEGGVMTRRDYAVDPIRHREGELTYYVAVREQPIGINGAVTERYQVHALSGAAAMRRVLRRAKFNDGRFNVESVVVEKVER